MIPTVLWLCGPSSVGKTTTGKLLADKLQTVHLDGDELRRGINSDLGFTSPDRNEASRRVAHIANLYTWEGKNVVVSMINALPTQRTIAASIATNSVFIRLTAAEHILQARDTKGIYGMCREDAPMGFGEIMWNAGIQCTKTYDTGVLSADDVANDIMDFVFLNR